MLCFTQSTGYAIQALACAAGAAGQPCLIREIAKRRGIPKPYLARVISRLARQGLIATQRGYGGGILLRRPARDLSLLEVVEAMEGKAWIGPCTLGMGDCNDQCTCPLSGVWLGLRKKVQEQLRRRTLADVVAAEAKVAAGARKRLVKAGVQP
jgi:Rrf2 family transcriptional regulator, iron-sulfur cluster assembly transcription factor